MNKRNAHNNVPLLIVLLVCLPGILFFGAPAHVKAVTPPIYLEVDVPLDSADPAYAVCSNSANDCSLRGAITKANTDTANVYTLALPAGTYTLSVGGRHDDLNAGGDLDVISGTLTIWGDSAETTTINGNDLDRVFEISDGAYLGLHDVRITGGYPGSSASYPGASGDDGGAILNAGTLNIQHCVFNNNSAGNGMSSSTAYSAGGHGGAIYNTGMLFISDTDFLQNESGDGGSDLSYRYTGASSGHGGAISNLGEATLDTVLIQQNATGNPGSGYPGGDAGHGAGIYSTGPLTVTNSILQENHTAAGASGMYSTGGNGGSGGAIFSTGTFVLSSSTIISNTTGGAGGPPSDTSNESHGGDGAGVYSNGTATISTSEFTGNITGPGHNQGRFGGSSGGRAGHGGGIYNEGTLTIDQSTLTSNKTGKGGNGGTMGGAAGGDGGDGGGLYNNGICSASTMTITLNTTGNGGEGSGSAQYDTTAGIGGHGGYGGGIFTTGTMTITRSLLSLNTTGDGGYADTDGKSGSAEGGHGGYGGGIYNALHLVIENTTLDSNSTGNGNDGTCNRSGDGCSATSGSGGYGGGIAQSQAADVTITNSALHSNSTGIGGDATGDSVVMNDGGNGGAIANYGEFVAISVNIADNYTSDSAHGGAIFNTMAPLTVINSTFTRNGSFGGGQGGAVFSVGDLHTTFINALFTANWADSYGGAIYADSSDPAFVNCTFVENTAHWDLGSVLYNDGTGAPEIYNSILWSNTGGNPIDYASNAPIVKYSLIEGGYSGIGNLNVDPKFVRNPDAGDGNWYTDGDNDYGDLHLTSNAPAIDAGNNNKLPVDLYDLDSDNDFAETLPDDLDHNPRILDTTWIADTGKGAGPDVDMGAYEYTPAYMRYLPIVQ